MANIKNATLYLWVYTGQYGARPIDANYVLYKEVKTGSDVITFEISELVKDYIDVSFTGSYSDIVQTAWAEWDIVQVFADNSTNTLSGAAIASLGYGYFEDGINPLLPQGTLLSATKLYNLSGSNLYIPFLTGTNAKSAFKAGFYNNNSLVQEVIFGSTISSITADTTAYTADTTLLTADSSLFAGSSSNDIEYLPVPVNANKLITTLNDNTTETKSIETIEECKQTPYKISFLNKFGVVQDLWFFKRRDESVEISKSKYLQNTIKEAATGVSYSLNQASQVPMDFKVAKSLKLNTGFIDEQYNETIQQLMLTESAWIHEDNNVFPILPTTSNLQYKTQLNDKLINFTVDFDYAYNEINLIK